MNTLQLIQQSAVRPEAISADLSSAQFVLIGEASHGTHEFYRTRAELTKHLIEEQGFDAVVVEADWPDAYEVNRYVRGKSDAPDAESALSGFRRFPTWMWRNADVLDFVGWLRDLNQSPARSGREVGFYGMDLYSLNSSMDVVIDYLRGVDPEAAERARRRYACFDHFGGNTQAYGYFASSGLSKTCEDEVVAQLKELQRRGFAYLKEDGRAAEDELFSRNKTPGS
jgi:erythromycin esterase-like protein